LSASPRAIRASEAAVEPPSIAATSVDHVYARLLLSATEHHLGGRPAPAAAVRSSDGRLEPLPLDRWIAPADAADQALIAGLADPVLDLGCGPGRHVVALAAHGKRALGVERSTVAVRIARFRGADVIAGSLWGDVPGGTTWRTILLLDGNIGIGGAPAALLRRAAELLAPGGLIVVETGPPDAPTQRTRVRLECDGAVSEWFHWAQVGATGIGAVADAAGLAITETRVIAGRSFAMLRRP
jgi:SAM-dependent methyltransferase